MKNLILPFALSVFSLTAYSQAWMKGGNNPSASPFSLGSNSNDPIFFETFGINRTKLNGSIAYPVNTFAGARDGFFLLGNDGNVVGGTLYGANRGAFSLLHLNGNSNGIVNVQEFGYRNWMRTGITFTDNNDRAYIGYKANAPDESDFIVNWSDNSVGGVGSAGPDNLLFNFTAGTGTNTNGIDGNQPNGREVVRMTGYGNVGIGPRFNNTQVPIGLAQGQPQSLLHLNNFSDWSSWMQFSNQSVGQTTSDGLRIGIVGAIQNPANPLFISNGMNTDATGTAMIYNQENRPMLFSVNHTTNSFLGLPNTPTNERVRIMALNTTTQLANGAYGIYNPGGLGNGDITRISISHDPSDPVTRPLSLLHLGYNTGAVSLGGASTDGWRNWMDIGTFTSNGTDNMYVGLKQEPGLLSDRYDAVVSWGDNQVSGLPPGNGPDYLRFIFTSTLAPSGGGTPPATSNNGLEVMRMHPGIASTLTNNYGMVGVGDFTTAAPIDAKLDVDGDMRIRTVANDNTLTQILAIDPTDLNRVKWVDASNIGGVGNYCSAPTQNPLTDEYEIPMNGFNYYFNGQAANGTNSSVGVGFPCYNPLGAKLDVLQKDPNPFTGVRDVAVQGTMIDFSSAPNQQFIGVVGNSSFNDPNAFPLKATHIGGAFFADGGFNNAGVFGSGRDIDPGAGFNAGGRFEFFGPLNPTETYYGVYAKVPPSSANITTYAGWFEGDVFINSPTGVSGVGYVMVSDQMFKNNIDTISNAIGIINQLQPKTFYFDTTGFNQIHFSSKKQYGVIAQDVETILPELVTSHVFPAQYDSLGVLVSQQIDYKGVNYNAFIAILTKGIQEQQKIIHNQDSLISSLDARLAQLENCINNLNLCNSSQMQNNNSHTPSNNTSNVELSDAPSVVLDQNVPNPFAEQTTITFTLNEGVNKAQMLFYNMEGKLINSVDLSTQSGKGQINVFANDLSTGIYTYTLVVDGKIIDTKRMVKR